MSTPDRCPTASWEQEPDAPKQLPGLFPGLLPSMSPAATAHVETPRFDLHDVINVEAVRPAVLRLAWMPRLFGNAPRIAISPSSTNAVSRAEHRPARAEQRPDWQGPALAPSGSPLTRR